MPDILHTEYGRLFRVSLLHDAWLSRGGMAFERLDAAGQRGVRSAFDSRRLLRVRPAGESAKLMQRHALVMIADAGGLLVGARLQRPPGGGAVMQRPPRPGFRLRLLLFLAEAALPSYSNLPLISGGGFYRFGTRAGNLDPFGAHLSARLPVFDQDVRYRIGDTVVNDADAPAERSVALRDKGPGARQVADWTITGALPPADPGPFPPGQIQQGDRIRRDGFVYQALGDDPGNDLDNGAEWRRLFPISFQGVSQVDRLELRRSRFQVNVAAAGASSVHVELRDEDGRHLAWSQASAPAPDQVETVTLDLGARPPGAYRIRLVGDDGRLLEQAPGQPLTGADQTVYVDDEAAGDGAFGVLEIGADDPGYTLLNQDGTLRSPDFLLRFLSRPATWRYHFPRDLTAEQVAAIPPTLVQDGARVLRTADVHPLGGDFVTLNRFNSGHLLPNPAPDQPLRLLDGRLVADLYLNH